MTMRLCDAMPNPAPMTDDPTYSGCANQRYGPDEVTSRDLFRWPAAQMRSASPAAAIDMPTAIDLAVGSAAMSTSGAKTHPSATRNRASSCVDTAGSITESPFDGAEHFVDLDLLEAHAIARASTQMM